MKIIFKIYLRVFLKFIIHSNNRIDSIKNSISLALNESYIEMEKVLELKENDELAIIPPISGG